MSTLISPYQCRCGSDNCPALSIMMNPEIIFRLTAIEVVFNAPIIITSAIRCELHNAAVGGHENSLHLSGDAVDVKRNGIYKKPEIFARQGFKVLVYPTFFHLQLKPFASGRDVVYISR